MFLMRILPMDITYKIKEGIVLDGLYAARGGVSGVEDWAVNYCPDEDLWVRGEKRFVEDVCKYLVDSIGIFATNIDRWMLRADELVKEIDKE